MNATESITPRASGPPTLSDLVAEIAPLIGTVVVTLVAATLLLTLAGARASR
jgi:hypothetical protein